MIMYVYICVNQLFVVFCRISDIGNDFSAGKGSELNLKESGNEVHPCFFSWLANNGHLLNGQALIAGDPEFQGILQNHTRISLKR